MKNTATFGRSLSSHVSDKNIHSHIKEKANSSSFNSPFAENKLNEKLQHDAGVRRFMKKVVSRILK